MAAYTNDLRLKEIGTGESSGTWGTETNTNLELIAEAFSFGTEAITTNADTHTTTIADGSTDPGRSIYLKYTGTLDSACTITIGPNTVSKLWFIENGTSGSQNIIISQGSGANVTIPAGHVKAVYSDGAGSGAAIVDAFTNLNLGGTTTVDDLTISDDLTVTDDMTVGGTLGVTGIVTLSDDLIIGDGKTIGSASDVDAMTIASNGQVTFSQTLIGTALDISGDIDVDGTTNLDAVDIDGAVDMASTLAVGGVVTANAGVVVDNFTLDGTTLALSSGTMTLDSANQLVIDVDGGIVQFKDAGTEWAQLKSDSTDVQLISIVQDKDIIFRGNDGGSFFNALTLDMSDAGRASFNNKASFNNAIAIGQSSFTGGNTLMDIHGSGSGVGANMAFANDHNTDKFFVGIAGDTTGDALVFNAENSDMIFGTNNSERMRIDSSGLVGIGTTSPTEKLTVAGNIANVSGDMTLDVAGDIILDADGGDIRFRDGGTEVGTIVMDDGSNTFIFKSAQSDADIKFNGNDGGSGVTALTLDMSNAGAATFNKGATFGGDITISEGTPAINFTDTDNNYDASIAGLSGSLVLTADANAEFGTETIQFHTGGSQRVTIDASGNVGIGTTSPDDELDVEGADPAIRLTDTSASGYARLFANNGSLLLQSDEGNSVSNSIIGFDVDGTERMRINSSGNVGIGTTSPSRLLDIENSTASGSTLVSLVSATDGNVQLLMGDTSSDTQGKVLYDNSSDFMSLHANGAERMRLDSSGNVGIGTTSPSEPLHVNEGTGGVSTTLLLQNSSASVDGRGTNLTFKSSSTEIGQIQSKTSSDATSGILAFKTASSGTLSEQMRIDKNGNVGIGTTSPSQLLNLKANTPFIQFSQDGSDSFAGINFGDADDANDGQILYDHDSRFMRFQVANNERMRIDSSGSLHLGTTSEATGSTGGATFSADSSNRRNLILATTGSGSLELVEFRNPNGTVGTIKTSGSATSYNTSSDARLKDVTGSARGLEVINELNPVAYNWKADGKADEGLIAQEVLDIAPNAVSGSEENMYQIDYSKLVTHLVKAVQEQQEQIESLTSEIAILKEK